MKKIFLRLLMFGTAIVILFIFLIILSNIYVIKTTEKNIVSTPDSNNDCIIVLGCGVLSDGTPTHMLKDRLDTALELYNKGIASKIIVSGDHGTYNYDEVNVMKSYLIERNVPSECVFMDHAGFSTYDSIYRAKNIFGVNNAVVVTQKYHLYRALYVADSLGINAEGVYTPPTVYGGEAYYNLREYLARTKEFVKCIFKPEATLLGEKISVNGNADITNDK